MSVLACDREGCRNIMCSLLVDEMYICCECADEFEGLMAGHPHMGIVLVNEFRKFMKTEKWFPRNGGYGMQTAREFLGRPT